MVYRLNYVHVKQWNLIMSIGGGGGCFKYSRSSSSRRINETMYPNIQIIENTVEAL